MRVATQQHGFSVVELLVLLVVLGILGFVGFSVHDKLSNRSQTSTASQASPSSSKATTAAVPEIKTTSDLDKAATTLDQTDVDANNASDSNQLSSDLSF